LASQGDRQNGVVPTIWKHTVNGHRDEVQRAILAATATLVAERGFAAVTLAQIGERVGVGRATVYRYFPDVETILGAWYAQERARTRDRLGEIADRYGPSLDCLLEALRVQARAEHEHPFSKLAVCLHGNEMAAGADNELRRTFETLLEDAVNAGHVRDDVPLQELAHFCVLAASGAATATSMSAVERLLALTVDAIERRW
jgi:AcrR family transcriptional regulator